MADLADNPIRLTYAALWDLLEAQSQFTDAVAEPNRIKYTGTDRAPEKSTGMAPAHFPQVRLVPSAMIPHLKRTSNGSSMTVIWSVQVNSGDQRVAEILDVDWAIYLALEAWDTELMNGDDAPTWNSERFIRRCRPLEVKVRMDDDGKIKGWRDAWMGETDLWFATADLSAE